MSSPFTRYQKFIMIMLGVLQFTIILDFMILAPLGAVLMPTLGINPTQFGWVVSVYAFSAGLAGFLAAGFLDRFDRKKVLLVFYSGFLLGTLLCGIVNDYRLLLVARVVTGLFGGVIGSVIFAITTDLFSFEVRGRVMGVISTAMAASQVLGLPAGLYLSNHGGWHTPFLAIVAVGILIGFVIATRMQPVDAHLKRPGVEHNPIKHLSRTVSQPRYLQAFATTALLATGGFMIMPFSSAFTVHNLKIGFDQLPIVYMVTGLFSIVTMPLIGRLCDKIGTLKLFIAATLLGCATVAIYTNLSDTTLAVVVLVSVVMFVGISSRMISMSTLMSLVPKPEDPGAFMSVSSSIQQISGGVAASLGGMIVVSNADGSLANFSTLGDIVIGAMLVTLVMVILLHRTVKTPKAATSASPAVPHADAG